MLPAQEIWNICQSDLGAIEIREYLRFCLVKFIVQLLEPVGYS